MNVVAFLAEASATIGTGHVGLLVVVLGLSLLRNNLGDDGAEEQSAREIVGEFVTYCRPLVLFGWSASSTASPTAGCCRNSDERNSRGSSRSLNRSRT